MRTPKRTYEFRKIYVVICSECSENIVERADEGHVSTRAQAQAYARVHEDAHRYDEGPE